MTHPKRWRSNMRTAKRRTHSKAATPTLAERSNYGSWYIHHTICPKCGYYRGQLVIEQEEAQAFALAKR